MEFDKISDNVKKANVLRLTKIIRETIIYSPEIRQRAIELEKLDTIRKMDSLHIASAESGHADIFLSTDNKLLKACQRLRNVLKVKVKNPLFYLAEVNEHD
jgi:predicted nucleic acid-binding protein